MSYFRLHILNNVDIVTHTDKAKRACTLEYFAIYFSELLAKWTIEG